MSRARYLGGAGMRRVCACRRVPGKGRGAGGWSVPSFPTSFPVGVAALNLAKGDDEFGGQRELGVVGDDQVGSVLEDEVHLVFAGMGDLDLDEEGFVEGPWFWVLGRWHSRNMMPGPDQRQISTGDLFPTLTFKRPLRIPE